MRTFDVHRGCCIEGKDIVLAVEANFKRLARVADIGNVAGYILDHVEIDYRDSILGGKGGAELRILSHGQDLAHRKANTTPVLSTVWIYAKREDIPQKHVFEIRE